MSKINHYCNFFNIWNIFHELCNRSHASRNIFIQSKHFRFHIYSPIFVWLIFDMHLMNIKFSFQKNRFLQKIHLFDLFFILYRFYSKFILIYSRFCTSLMSNLIIHKSSLLKKKNIITIRIYFHSNFSNQVHLNYTTFNIYLNYSKFIFIWIIRNSSSFELFESYFHLNYSTFIFIWIIRRLKFTSIFDIQIFISIIRQLRST